MAQTSKIDAVYKIAKNSVAMMVAGALAKGGGLIVTILVARYLGVASLGVYAVVLALFLLLETITPLGQQEVIIRAIARNRSRMVNFWANASVIALLAAFGFDLILIAIVRLNDFSVDFRLAIFVAASGLPIAALNLVAQSVLQGVERMEFQAIGAFIGRLLGLLLLWILLEIGAGIWSAFAGRAVFQLTSFLFLARAIYRHAQQNKLSQNWYPSFSVCKKNLSTSVPFAIQKILNEGLLRINVIILPALVAIEAVGQFNAANQIAQTTATIIPIVMLTVLPIFSKSFETDRSEMNMLADQTLKFLLIVIFPFVFIVAVSAHKIIWLLYGSGYEAAGLVLQFVIWTQIIIAADSVMTQNMIASDNERAMVWRAAIGVSANIALTVLLSKLFGILGIAAAVVIARAILLILDAEFVIRNISVFSLKQSVGKPFICALLAGISAFLLNDQGLLVMVSVSVMVYGFCLWLFKVFKPNELSMMQQLFKRFFSRFAGLFYGKNVKNS